MDMIKIIILLIIANIIQIMNINYGILDIGKENFFI